MNKITPSRMPRNARDMIKILEEAFDMRNDYLKDNALNGDKAQCIDCNDLKWQEYDDAVAVFFENGDTFILTISDLTEPIKLPPRGEEKKNDND